MIRIKEDKRFYVYVWIRLDTNQVFYVGKGSNNRYKDMLMRNKYFYNVVNKVGKDNIEIKIIENNLTEDEAFEKEKYYIQYYKEQGNKLTNMTSGGEGSSDWFEHLTEEEKERHRQISKSFEGKKHTEETKQKIREAHIGMFNITEDGRKRISESAKGRKGFWKGKHLTEETKQKISQTRKEKNIPSPASKKVYVLNCEFIKIEEFMSRTSAMNTYGYKVRTCVEYNSKISNLNQAKLYNDKCFIYEQDYNLLMSQSTIETIAFGEANVKTE